MVTLSDHLALRRFVEREGVGVVLDDVADMADAVREMDMGSLRRTVAEKRDRFTFEAQIPEVIELYRDLAAGRRRSAAPLVCDPQTARRGLRHAVSP